ncbi:CG1523 [Drosophila busckii]|uniref:CG1523 n=2 Tax=Drosophila busckii TaxID=30019 RepID=A0A0M3QY82_DROBS|nr:CG1523 [Drosophila busckii]
MDQYLSRRESGWLHLNKHTGEENHLMQRIYSSMAMFNSYHANCIPSAAGQATGAIFNVEFNGDGNVLIAATERKCVLGFDAITQQEIFKVPDAHTSSVNCIKFLDDRLFATGSDDFTVALWDLRNMKQKIRVLHGHSNWVKNIEYSSKDKLLVTSGFDGSIFTWDINSQTEQGLISQRVFHASGLMRCRISPAGDKLVLCTSSGYIMIVHHLDLTTLHKDLCGFRPGIYRLMQLGDQFIPQAAKYDHVFSRRQKKNRVELVTDFPEQNDAEMIMALQIDPHCRCMLTRNMSCDEQSEWTCIHDINEEPEHADKVEEEEEEHQQPTLKKRRTLLNQRNESQGQHQESEHEHASESRPSLRRTLFGRPGRIMPLGSTPAASFIPDIWAAEVTVQERAIRQSRARNSNNHVSGYNFVYAISSGVLPLRTSRRITDTSEQAAEASSPSNINNNSNGNSNNNNNNNTNSSSSSTSSSSSSSTASNFNIRMRMSMLADISATVSNDESATQNILVNAKKLLYYTSETNNKPGLIKEPGFSADGRIICSPYANGVRLLSYKQDCSDYPNQLLLEEIKQQPRPLIELVNIIEHQDVVLCAKFSPREPLLVTGCNSGEIAWYRPCL